MEGRFEEKRSEIAWATDTESKPESMRDSDQATSVPRISNKGEIKIWSTSVCSSGPVMSQVDARRTQECRLLATGFYPKLSRLPIASVLSNHSSAMLPKSSQNGGYTRRMCHASQKRASQRSTRVYHSYSFSSRN